MVNEESTVHTVANYSIQMQPTSYYGFAPAPLPSKILCSQSKCKAILPAGYKFKTCDQCHTISKLSMQKKRKREDADEGPHRQQATAPSGSLKEKGPIEYIHSGSDTELTPDETKVSKSYRLRKRLLPQGGGGTRIFDILSGCVF